MADDLIMHVDMDAFFAAIEQRDNPDLRGKPVVVGALPGGRGVVSTCSYEARVFGIRSAMPIAEAYRRCPDAVYLRPDGRRYIEASRKLMELLGEISPIVEPVSVDEAYVDISGLSRLFGSPSQIGMKTRSLIRERLNLTGSVGIGPTRSVAKIASDQQKPNGLTVVLPEQVEDFLAPLPVRELRGVGKVTMKRLHKEGIRLVRHIQELDQSTLQRLFGENGGGHLYRQAHGISSSFVGLAAEQKQISQEVTFSEDLDDADTIQSTLLQLACGIGRIARRKGVQGYVVTVKYRLPGFETHTRQRKLPAPTNWDMAIFEEGQRLLAETKAPGRPLRLVGIGLSNLVPVGTHRVGLFGGPDRVRADRLYDTLDKIAEKYGKNSISPAGAAGGKRRRPK